MEHVKNLKSWSWVLILVTIAVGIYLRFYVGEFGHNYDVESYRMVADIVSKGGNVYAETHRYNYGPLWSIVLQVFNHIAWILHDPGLFKILITLFLSIVDLGIAACIFWYFGLIPAVVFFLNPISVLISGYHRQFDNVAVLIAFISVVILHVKRLDRFWRIVLGGIVLGVSLVVKHVFIFFPVWLAFRFKSWRERLLIILIPLTVFFISFVPYWSTGHQGIIDNVFGYDSFNNAPLFRLIIPEMFFEYFNLRYLFYGMMLAVGWDFRYEKNLARYFAIYTGALVLFSSAIANQYLAIAMVFVAVNLNVFGVLYALYVGYYLLVDFDGLYLRSLYPDLIVNNWSLFYLRENAYQGAIVLLGLACAYWYLQTYRKEVLRLIKSKVLKLFKLQ